MSATRLTALCAHASASGHDIQQERPKEVNTALVEFIRVVRAT
jgi:hypothetical protein